MPSAPLYLLDTNILVAYVRAGTRSIRRPFPDWVSEEVLRAASKLTRDQAARVLPVLAFEKPSR